MTLELGKNTNVEMFSTLGYDVKINPKINGSCHVENVTNIGRNGHNFSLQKVRVGLAKDRYTFGVALDFEEYNNGLKGEIGGFLKSNF